MFGVLRKSPHRTQTPTPLLGGREGTLDGQRGRDPLGRGRDGPGAGGVQKEERQSWRLYEGLSLGRGRQ